MELEKLNDSNKTGNEMIELHLDFVKAQAKKAITKFSCVELDDLIQAGNLGLTIAANSFNQKKADRKGATFETYAYFWIQKYMILEYLRTKYVLHVPDKNLRRISYKRKVFDSLEKQLNREPFFNEIAERIAIEKEISESEAKKILANIRMAEAQVYSIDMKIRNSSNTTFADFIPDPYRFEILWVESSDFLDVLSIIIKRLTPRERTVLYLRVFEDYTSNECANVLHVSIQRSQQIWNKTIRKIKRIIYNI